MGNPAINCKASIFTCNIFANDSVPTSVSRTAFIKITASNAIRGEGGTDEFTRAWTTFGNIFVIKFPESSKINTGQLNTRGLEPSFNNIIPPVGSVRYVCCTPSNVPVAKYTFDNHV